MHTRILTGLFICLCFSAFSQEKLVEKGKVRLATTTKVILESYSNGSTGEHIRIFENSLGIKKIPDGSFKGHPYEVKQPGVMFDNGTTVVLRSDERIIDFKGERLLTIWPVQSATNAIPEMCIYRVSNNELTLEAKRNIELLQGGFSLLDNGTVIVSDEMESQGSKIQLYSANLTPLTLYKPFPNGFKEASVVYSDNNIIMVCSNRSGDQVKVATFQGNSGNLLNEGAFPFNSDLQLVQAIGDNLFIYGTGELYAYSLTGRLLWKKPLLLPHLDLLNNNKDVLFGFTLDQVVCIDAASGNVSWTKPLASLITRVSAKGKWIRPASIITNPEDQTVNFLFCTTDEIVTLTAAKYNANLLRFKKEGTLLDKVFIVDETRDLKLTRPNKGLEVITDFEKTKYE